MKELRGRFGKDPFEMDPLQVDPFQEDSFQEVPVSVHKAVAS